MAEGGLSHSVWPNEELRGTSKTDYISPANNERKWSRLLLELMLTTEKPPSGYAGRLTRACSCYLFPKAFVTWRRLGCQYGFRHNVVR